MKRVIPVLQLLGAIALTLFGGALGAAVGFANGGWVGAVCLGIAGLAMGAFVAAGGLMTFLQILSFFV